MYVYKFAKDYIYQTSKKKKINRL